MQQVLMNAKKYNPWMLTPLNVEDCKQCFIFNQNK
jgi:hypothetical protein